MTDYTPAQAIANGWDPEAESLEDFNNNVNGNNEE